MDEDKFALVEKILKDVHNVLTKNAELCSFDIVPVESNFRNKSPVLHLENCLGLESWCVKHVYMYCYSRLMDKCFSKPKHKALKVTSLVSDEFTKLLNVTLLLNPELTFLWNKRREMVQQGFLDKPSEMRFAKVVLSRKPKCNDAFSYRRWLLDDILKIETHQSIQTLNEELHICQLASDKSPNNYHSWSHRTWMLSQLTQTKDFDLLHLMFIKEYKFSQHWTAKHVSDFSCYHYRQFCIRNIFQITDESYKIFKTNIDSDLRRCLVRALVKNLPNNNSVVEENLLDYSNDTLVSFLLSYPSSDCSCMPNSNLICRKLELLFHELVLNDELIRFYKHHETLWYHRRFVIHEIIVLIYEYFAVVRQNGVLVKNPCKCKNQKQAKIVKYDCSTVYSSPLFNVIKNSENTIIHERRLDNDNYADRHEKYLKFVEGLNNVM